MKKKLLISAGILMILVILSSTVTGFIMLKDYLDNMNSNFMQAIEDLPDQNYVLKQKDFKKYSEAANDKLLKQLMDSMNIKYKHIVQTYDNNYNYSYDTTITLNYDYTMPQTTFKRFLYRPDSCINIEGKIDWANDSLTFEIFEVNIDSKTVYFWRRINRNGNKTIWPFGEKEINAISTNNCSGQTETKRITVKRYNNE